ncbi:MAG: hypothetical protein ACK42C_03610 [Aquificaceae bacterium]|uniref:hypothetical protein n=1 Tax=Hydrogenobacter sp. Uz 6-8 TaxID=3384828 RepID=UPI0030963840
MRFEEFRAEVEGLELFNRGWRGYIYRGVWKGERVAIKVARDRERVYAIKKECEILRRLLGMKGFPQLLYCGEEFIVYTFIEGVPIEKKKLTIQEKVDIYLRILELIKILDSLGINKEELQRLDKNTLIGEDGNVYLLDFERGSPEAKKLHNLTQFLQLLVREGFLQRERAKELGMRYSGGEKVYDEVAQALRAFT